MDLIGLIVGLVIGVAVGATGYRYILGKNPEMVERLAAQARALRDRL